MLSMLLEVMLIGGWRAGAICQLPLTSTMRNRLQCLVKHTVIVYGGVPFVGFSDMSVHCERTAQFHAAV